MQLIDELISDCRDAALNLKRRRTRTLLSGLGITVGVAALVAMLSIGEGARQEAEKKIATLGINTIRVENSMSRSGRDDSFVNLSAGLTVDDAVKISSWLGRLGDVGVYARADNVAMSAGPFLHPGTVIGASPDWFTAENLAMTRGRPLVPEDLNQYKKNCVIGSRIEAALHSQLGDILHAGDMICTVVGVLQPRGSLLTEGTGLSTIDFDDVVIVPLTSFPLPKVVAGRQVIDGMVVAVRSADKRDLLDTAKQIDELLSVEHRKVDDYRLVVPMKLLQESRQTQRLFSLVMGSIAGLSLLVGGIGVMNVMLANVSEQTREIGLRIAVGASRRRIINLYLWHSVLLTLGGSIAGLAGGVLLAFLIQDYAGWSVSFSILSIILGPVCAVLTGLLFGLHPAMQAAALNPAIALREA